MKSDREELKSYHY